MNIVTIIGSVILSGGATAYLTELLKSPLIKVPAERFPRTVSFVLSVVASGLAFAANGVNFMSIGSDWVAWATVSFATFLVATITYNQAIRER